jgi:hypothetical protein
LAWFNRGFILKEVTQVLLLDGPFIRSSVVVAFPRSCGRVLGVLLLMMVVMVMMLLVVRGQMPTLSKAPSISLPLPIHLFQCLSGVRRAIAAEIRGWS